MGQVINKGEFVKKFGEKTELGATKANEMVNAFIGLVQEELVAGNEVNITGFGKFHVAESAAREGVNPGTKEKIQIAATQRPKFKAGKQLKDAVNK